MFTVLCFSFPTPENTNFPYQELHEFNITYFEQYWWWHVIDGRLMGSVPTIIPIGLKQIQVVLINIRQIIS